MLTAIDRPGRMSDHSASCASAESTTHCVSGPIRPVLSAIGMKSLGGTRPRTGCIHRTSASNATTCPVRSVDLRLVVQHQFAGRNRAAQFGDQAQPLRIELVDARVVAHDRGAGGLRRVEREVGATQQRLGRLGVVGPHRVAHAGLGRDGDTGQFGLLTERLLQSAQNPLHRIGRGARQHDAELVAAESGDRVAGPHRCGQSFGDDAQELVAVAMTERVVDFLEAVEVDHHQRHVGTQATGRGQARPTLGRHAAPGWAGRSACRAAP